MDAMTYSGLANNFVSALLGYAAVFVGLIFLQIVVMLVGKAFSLKEKKAVAAAPAAPAPVVPVSTTEAPGSAGRLKLHDVEPKTAAMVMAIIADKLQKPLNELRFISIKEVK